MLQRLLGGEKHSEDVCIEHSVELLFGNLFQRDELVNAGVVHQNVGFAERFFRRCWRASCAGQAGRRAIDAEAPGRNS